MSVAQTRQSGHSGGVTEDRQSAPMTHAAAALADALYTCVIEGALIEAPVDPISLDEAYAVQSEVFEKREIQLAGWKLATTSGTAQKAMGLSCPIVGRLAGPDILWARREVEAPRGPVYAEAELAVTLHSNLPARSEPYGAREVAAAIGEVHAAIELCSSRYADDDVDAAPLIADNAFAYRLVLGRALAIGWHPRFAAMTVSLDCGAGRTINGSTAAVMGNPINAVTWLANWLSRRGLGLRSGQVVATGSCTGIVRLDAGDAVRALFAGQEGVAATITSRTPIGRNG